MVCCMLFLFRIKARYVWMYQVDWGGRNRKLPGDGCRRFNKIMGLESWIELTREILMTRFSNLGSLFCRCERVNSAGLTSRCWTLYVVYKVNSNSNHCLLIERPSVSTRVRHILELRLQLIHWILKYPGVFRPNLQGVFCRPKFACGMTVPSLHVFGTRTLYGFK